MPFGAMDRIYRKPQPQGHGSIWGFSKIDLLVLGAPTRPYSKEQSVFRSRADRPRGPPSGAWHRGKGLGGRCASPQRSPAPAPPTLGLLDNRQPLNDYNNVLSYEGHKPQRYLKMRLVSISKPIH